MVRWWFIVLSSIFIVGIPLWSNGTKSLIRVKPEKYQVTFGADELQSLLCVSDRLKIKYDIPKVVTQFEEFLQTAEIEVSNYSSEIVSLNISVAKKQIRISRSFFNLDSLSQEIILSKNIQKTFVVPTVSEHLTALPD